MSNEDLSRRDALTGGTAVIAAVGAAMAVSAVTRDAEAQNAADAMALNGLLRAEYEAIAAYNTAIPLLTDPTAAAAAAVATHFKDQHVAHAQKLVPLVTAAGGTPVAQATVFFMPPAGFTGTLPNILKLATNKEKAAAIAYAEALKTISSKTAAEVVAAIGGVETQHFIVLYLLTLGVVQPGAMASMVDQIVPKAFVSIIGSTGEGLDSVQDFEVNQALTG